MGGVPSVPLFGCLLACLLAMTTASQWYDGVKGIKVLSPGDSDAQATVDAIAAQQHSAETGQFNDKRYAILLRPGTHNISVGVGYYTSVIGVGATAADVVVGNVESFDVDIGGATQNFWRSAEGLTVRNSSTTWAVSQACPLRRMVFEGDLWLSEQGPGTHWSSGGFLADCDIQGQLHTGTQQQFCFRNSALSKAPDIQNAGWNYVFVGVSGAPETSATGKPDEVTNVGPAPRGAEKPFLVDIGTAAGAEEKWQIWVPSFTTQASTGRVKPPSAGPSDKLDLSTEVFVARASRDKGSDISTALATGRFKAILLTPGIYEMDKPLEIATNGTVILGIGFPTLVSTSGQSAVVVAGGLSDVRVAGILLEAGTAKEDSSEPTAPLLRWGHSPTEGPCRRCALADVFARVGAFAYETPFKPSCLKTRADTLVEINAAELVVDNTWFWHADHDDCGTASDQCYSQHGLVVNADDVTIYGLASEHQMGDLVRWNGDAGQVFFFQSELPYHDPQFGPQGFAGYAVSATVTSHEAWGVGVYIIGGELKVAAAVRAPLGSTNFTNMLTLVLGGQAQQFGATICDASSNGTCLAPETCSGTGCYLHSSRVPPVPSIPGSCRVGSDAFLQGKAGVNAPTPVTSWQGCAESCKAYASLPCKFWKYGPGGNWCQFFSSDVASGSPIWPIPGAVNATSSAVISGTIDC